MSPKPKRSRRLVYWVACRLDDSEAYSIRARTRRECVARRAQFEEPDESFGPPHKVIVTYTNAFDLLDRVLGEGFWEG